MRLRRFPTRLSLVAVLAFAIVPAIAGASPALAADSTWTAVTYQNGFSNSSGSLSYRKDAGGFVHIGNGWPTGGTDGTAMFTLPTGYRPATTEAFPVNGGGLLGYVFVNSDGTVVPHVNSFGSYLVFGNLIFYAGPADSTGSGGNVVLTDITGNALTIIQVLLTVFVVTAALGLFLMGAILAVKIVAK